MPRCMVAVHSLPIRSIGSREAVLGQLAHRAVLGSLNSQPGHGCGKHVDSEGSLKQLRIAHVFFLVVVFHFLINFIDQPSGMLGLANALTTTSFVTVFLVVVRMASGALSVGDLLQWCAARRRTFLLWMVCTLAVLVQVMVHWGIGSVSALLAVSSLISASCMFAAFLSVGAWLHQRLLALWQ